MFEGKEVHVILAQSGGGKTTNFMKIIEQELQTKRPEEIAFVTFTRKGAEEGVRRMCNKFMYTPDDLPYFRTLHSLTFKALNLKRDNIFNHIDERKFNQETGYNLNRCDVANGNIHPTKDSVYLDYYDLERSNSLTSQMMKEADIELGYYHRLVQKYEEYKNRQCLVDFFDCLVKYVQDGVSLPCKTVLIDECFSPETRVRMADLTIKSIKDIKVGDLVMGTKGATRVTRTCSGVDTMYNILTARKKVLFTCNSKHLIGKNESTNWTYAENIGNKGRIDILSCKGLEVVKCRTEEIGKGEYYGITVDAEDNCFLLANGCVVHNCQDISSLQWQVIDKAFKNAEKIYMTGDTSQSIYQYSGARPDILLSFARQYDLTYLSESYRLPHQVFLLAKGIVSFITEKIDEMPFNFHKGNPEGSITQMNHVDRLKNFIDAPKENSKDTSWYLLARNKCFLPRYCAMLEENLIPYWTPDGFFMGGQIMQRLIDYEGFRLEGYKNEVKKEQFKKKFGIIDFSKPFTETNLFTEGRKWVYAAYIEKYGLNKLKEMCKWNPQILVSTMHYVKGGEADNVAIMLDNTRKTASSLYQDVDSELRVLYVGVTRTKQNLFLIDSQGKEGYDKIIETIKDQFDLTW